MHNSVSVLLGHSFKVSQEGSPDDGPRVLTELIEKINIFSQGVFALQGSFKGRNLKKAHPDIHP